MILSWWHGFGVTWDVVANLSMSFFLGGGSSSSQLYHSFRNLAGVIGIGTGIYFVSSSLYNVEAGHRAIKYSRLKGIIEKVYGEGTHFAIPWIERPIVYDCRARPRSIASLTGTKGMNVPNSDIFLFFRPANGRHYHSCAIQA